MAKGHIDAVATCHRLPLCNGSASNRFFCSETAEKTILCYFNIHLSCIFSPSLLAFDIISSTKKSIFHKRRAKIPNTSSKYPNAFSGTKFSLFFFLPWLSLHISTGYRSRENRASFELLFLTIVNSSTVIQN